MSASRNDVERVRTLIERGFADAVRPSKVTKRVALALDDEWLVDEERRRELMAEDPEQRWEDLSDADVEEFCSILPSLDEEGLQFYLAAFMSYALRRFPSEGHRAISDIHDLCAGPKWQNALRPEQIGAVREFEALYGHVV
jgi:hypothetical protein